MKRWEVLLRTYLIALVLLCLFVYLVFISTRFMVNKVIHYLPCQMMMMMTTIAFSRIY